MMVSVAGAGMTTAIGLTGPATCAAIRARLANFQETRFISRDGERIIGAEAPLARAQRGVERLVHLVLGPLRECLDRAETRQDEIPILLCLAEKARVGRLDNLDQRIVARLSEGLELRSDRPIRIYPYGQVGGAVAVQDARRLIEAGTREVIVAGVDGLLLAGTLRAYDREDRLLTAGNSDAFIPGEAGAAVLLRADGVLRVRGVGFGVEEATIGSTKPLRADGMVQAMRGALQEAGAAYNDISYRIADLDGEQYYFKEAVLAQARLWRGKRDPEEVWHPCDSVGHTGAAAILICLGMALAAARKNYAPGPLVLIHASGDDGRRAALLLAAN